MDRPQFKVNYLTRCANFDVADNSHFERAFHNCHADETECFIRPQAQLVSSHENQNGLQGSDTGHRVTYSIPMER